MSYVLASAACIWSSQRPDFGLWLVYDLSLEQREDGQRKVYVKLTLTAPGCGMGDILVDDARTKLEMIPIIAEADIDLVFDPPWNHSMMSELAKLETGML